MRGGLLLIFRELFFAKIMSWRLRSCLARGAAHNCDKLHYLLRRRLIPLFSFLFPRNLDHYTNVTTDNGPPFLIDLLDKKPRILFICCGPFDSKQIAPYVQRGRVSVYPYFSKGKRHIAKLPGDMEVIRPFTYFPAGGPELEQAVQRCLAKNDVLSQHLLDQIRTGMGTFWKPWMDESFKTICRDTLHPIIRTSDALRELLTVQQYDAILVADTKCNYINDIYALNRQLYNAPVYAIANSQKHYNSLLSSLKFTDRVEQINRSFFYNKLKKTGLRKDILKTVMGGAAIPSTEWTIPLNENLNEHHLKSEMFVSEFPENDYVTFSPDLLYRVDNSGHHGLIADEALDFIEHYLLPKTPTVLLSNLFMKLPATTETEEAERFQRLSEHENAIVLDSFDIDIDQSVPLLIVYSAINTLREKVNIATSPDWNLITLKSLLSIVHKWLEYVYARIHPLETLISSRPPQWLACSNHRHPLFQAAINLVQYHSLPAISIALETDFEWYYRPNAPFGSTDSDYKVVDSLEGADDLTFSMLRLLILLPMKDWKPLFRAAEPILTYIDQFKGEIRHLLDDRLSYLVLHPLDHSTAQTQQENEKTLWPSELKGRRILLLCSGELPNTRIEYLTGGAEVTAYFNPMGGRKGIVDEALENFTVKSMLDVFQINTDEENKAVHEGLYHVTGLVDCIRKEIQNIMGQRYRPWMRSTVDLICQDFLILPLRIGQCLKKILSENDYDIILLSDVKATFFKELSLFASSISNIPIYYMHTQVLGKEDIQKIVTHSDDIADYVYRRISDPREKKKYGTTTAEKLWWEKMKDTARWMEPIAGYCDALEADFKIPAQLTGQAYQCLALAVTSTKNILGHDAIDIIDNLAQKDPVLVTLNVGAKWFGQNSQDLPWKERWEEVKQNPNMVLLEMPKADLDLEKLFLATMSILDAFKNNSSSFSYFSENISLFSRVYNVLLYWFKKVYPRLLALQKVFERRPPERSIACHHRMPIFKGILDLTSEFEKPCISAVPLLLPPGYYTLPDYSMPKHYYYSVVDSSQKLAITKEYGIDADHILQGSGWRYDQACRQLATFSADEDNALCIPSGLLVLAYFSQHSMGNVTFDTAEILGACASEIPGLAIFVKPHPSESSANMWMYRDYCGDFANGSVMRFVEPSQSTSALLKRCDCVVVHNSNLGIEGTLLGKPVLTLHPNGEHFEIDFEQIGFAKAARSRQEIKDTLDAMVNNPGFLESMRGLSRSYLKENPQFTDGKTLGSRLNAWLDSFPFHNGKQPG